MASENDKAHRKLVQLIGHSEVSPAILAYKMINESKYVNESTLQFLINYIIMMGTRKEESMPPTLHDTMAVCRELHRVLKELGLTNAGSR